MIKHKVDNYKRSAHLTDHHESQPPAGSRLSARQPADGEPGDPGAGKTTRRGWPGEHGAPWEPAGQAGDVAGRWKSPVRRSWRYGTGGGSPRAIRATASSSRAMSRSSVLVLALARTAPGIALRSPRRTCSR